MSTLRAVLLLLALLSTAHANAQQERQQIGAGAVAGLILLVLALLIGLICLDRRRGYPITRCLRSKIGQLYLYILKSKRSKRQPSEMLETDQAPHSAKRNLAVFQAEKITNDAESNEAMQEVLISKQPEVQMMEMEQDAPPVNMKDVFEKKESKTKHKINKKSKSKIRSRLQGKSGNEESWEKEGEDASQDNSLTEENQGSLPGQNALQTSASDS